MGLGTNKSGCSVDDDNCFYYHSLRNNVAVAFGNLLSFNPVYKVFHRIF